MIGGKADSQNRERKCIEEDASILAQKSDQQDDAQRIHEDALVPA